MVFSVFNVAVEKLWTFTPSKFANPLCTYVCIHDVVAIFNQLLFRHEVFLNVRCCGDKTTTHELLREQVCESTTWIRRMATQSGIMTLVNV